MMATLQDYVLLSTLVYGDKDGEFNTDPNIGGWQDSRWVPNQERAAP